MVFAPEIKRFAVTLAVSPARVVFADVFKDVVVIVTFDPDIIEISPSALECIYSVSSLNCKDLSVDIFTLSVNV